MKVCRQQIGTLLATKYPKALSTAALMKHYCGSSFSLHRTGVGFQPGTKRRPARRTSGAVCLPPKLSGCEVRAMREIG